MIAPPYTYRALIQRVIDADTLVVDVDLGFGVWLRRQNIRLLGCNARELSEPGGKDARAYVTTLLPAGSEVLLRSVKSDKYGSRYDAQVFLPGGQDLVDALVSRGWLARWGGVGTRPVPPWPPEPAA